MMGICHEGIRIKSSMQNDHIYINFNGSLEAALLLQLGGLPAGYHLSGGKTEKLNCSVKTEKSCSKESL